MFSVIRKSSPASRWSRPASCLAVGVAMLGLFQAGPLLAEQPTSAPTDEDVLAIRKLAPELGRRLWGPAVIETFQDKPDKPAWTADKVSYANGCLLAEPKGKVTGGMYLSRDLPDQLKNADGIQVQAWIKVEPGVLPVARRRVDYRNLAMSVGESTSKPIVTYFFACGNEGRIVRFTRDIRTGLVAKESPPLPDKNSVIYLKLEIIDRQLNASRDTTTLSFMDEQSFSKQLGKQTKLIISGTMNRLQLLKVTYRALPPADAVQNTPELWRKTRFADQQELTAYLLDNVIPRLDSKLFAERHEARQVLESCWPLSKPAIQERLQRGELSPEMETRLNAFSNIPITDTIVDPPADDPADAAPVDPDKPAASQPDTPGQGQAEPPTL